MLTLLRVMLTIQYFNLDTQFPWGLWLYAIILELDVFGTEFIQNQIQRHHIIHIKQMEEANNGGSGKT